ncbi:uncharacterized protein [Littorina saxatilis]|uniref:ORC1/DEAH AAA+ ATPase domain-containing protein n=1 Tax=Littorina saxatilis TaxID=31220 RepID=A0AAN9AXX0_9CAEN
MREPEGGLLSRVFIGRHDEREQIKTRLLHDGRIVLLFGQPQVGKASLALEVAEELRHEQHGDGGPGLCVYTVDCRESSDWPEIMRAICRAFSLDETFANENLLVGAILQQLHASDAEKLMLVLLGVNGLNPAGTDVQSMTRCLQSLAASDVMTLVTSRRQLKLPVVQRINPLTLNDAMELLRHHAPDVTATEFVPLLQRYCHGLPPLVEQMANLVSGAPMLAYTAPELTQALEEDSSLLMKGLSVEAKKVFATLSPEVKGHVSNLANLLDGGSFSLETFQAVVGLEGARVKSVLRILYDEAPLIIDNDTQRMRLEPLVLHHVRQLGHVAADDQARLRVVTLLGRVLTRAERELYVAGQDTVYGHLQGTWPQLQNVLRQAIHCTGNTYQAYLQVAMQAEKLLSTCFPHEALTFYKNMSAASVRFGTHRDQAVLQSLVGMAVTVAQGTGYEVALHHFHRALPVLEEDRRSVSYLRLLCDMGLTYHRMNRLHDAEKYLRLAVSVSEDTYVEDERELIFHLLRARSILALPTIFRGHLSESKALLFETLEMCEQHAPYHPSKPVLINSLGLVYERSGEDQDKAFQFYKQSLVERRRYSKVAPGDLVPTLNNVGMQYSRRGSFDVALEYLQEAADIRARIDRWHYYTALTQQHIGQVLIQKGDYKKAERHLEEAACVYARCTPTHDVRGKVALCHAHLYVTKDLRDVVHTKRHLTEVCRLAEVAEDDLSDNGLMVLASAVQHRVQLEGWVRSDTVTSLLTWMLKLLSNYDGDLSQQLLEHQAIVNDMLSAINSGDVTESQKEALTSRVMDQCQMCGNLSVNEDTLTLWRDSESKGQNLRSAIGALRRSSAIKNVLKLSEKKSSGEPVLGATADEREESRHHSVRMQQEGFTGLSLSVQNQRQKHEVLTGGISVGGLLQHQGNRQDQQEQDLTGTTSSHQDQRGGSVSGLLQGREQQQDYQRVLQLLNLNRDSQGFNSLHSEGRSSQQASDPRLAAHQHHNDELDIHTINSSRQSSFPERQSHQPAPGQTDHVTESDQYSSCSLTNSDPPMSISDAASSLESTGSGNIRLQEQETFCQRMIVPLQETARDQSSQGFNLNALADPALNSRPTSADEKDSGPLGSSATEAARFRRLQEQYPLGDASHSSYGGGSDWIGLRTLENLHYAEQARNQEVYGERVSLHTAQELAGILGNERSAGEDDTRAEVSRADISEGRIRSYMESSWPENAVFCDTLQSVRPLMPAQPFAGVTSSAHSPLSAPPVSRPHMTSQSVWTQHTCGSASSQAGVGSSPLLTLSSSQPPLTLQSVVTCAQQLMAVMPPYDVATREQRRALEKLASLADVSQLGEQSAAGGPRRAGLDPQTLLGLLPFEDQAAKLTFLETQHTHVSTPVPEQQHHSQYLLQSRPATQNAAQSSSQSQARTPRLHLPEHQSWPATQNASQSLSLSQARTPRLNPPEHQSRPATQSAAQVSSQPQAGTHPSHHPEHSGFVSIHQSHSPRATEISWPQSFQKSTELHGGFGQREPTTELEASMVESHSVRVAEPRHGTELNVAAARREATENDERLENPGHVCTSVHCQCSFRVYH